MLSVYCLQRITTLLLSSANAANTSYYLKKKKKRVRIPFLLLSIALNTTYFAPRKMQLCD